MNTMTHDTSLDDLDDITLHEPKPVKQKEPNEAEVIVVMATVWLVPCSVAQVRLAKLNFVDFEFQGASNG